MLAISFVMNEEKKKDQERKDKIFIEKASFNQCDSVYIRDSYLY